LEGGDAGGAHVAALVVDAAFDEEFVARRADVDGVVAGGAGKGGTGGGG
jgi:hypothetical protein